MPIDFKEFLRQKVDASTIRDRNRDRGEWLDALDKLLDQIRLWLHASDTEGVVEFITYEVERIEDRLGIYDAPALKIRLGTDEVNIVPVGRYSVENLPVQSLKSLTEIKGSDGLAGRVDVTNGERKYMLLRDVSTGLDRWYLVGERSGVALLDHDHLEMILQDLWS